MQVTRAAFQAVASLKVQATDPKSHTLVSNFYTRISLVPPPAIPMVDPHHAPRRVALAIRSVAILVCPVNQQRPLLPACTGKERRDAVSLNDKPSLEWEFGLALTGLGRGVIKIEIRRVLIGGLEVVCGKDPSGR